MYAKKQIFFTAKSMDGIFYAHFELMASTRVPTKLFKKFIGAI